MSKVKISDEVRERYGRDGAIVIEGALSPPTLRIAQAAFDWSLKHPGPGAASLPSKGDGVFYQDLANPAALKAYRELIHDTEVADIVRALWGKNDVWFMYEQVFHKHGGHTRRTPWHQDSPYLPIDGMDIAVMWISFDPVPAADSLEFVLGSHLGPMFDGSSFDVNDDTAPLYGTGELPRLPNIEADRGAFRIASWAVEPGDVLIFHPAMLHGGGATDPSRRRRTLSLRFFGEDAVVGARPGTRPRIENMPERNDESVHPLTRMRNRSPGAPFRDPGFPHLRG